MIRRFLPILIVSGLYLTANATMIIRGSGGEAGSPCPSFYNATDVVFSWDGDHTSGTNYGCDSAGTGVAGTNSSLTISTDYGESGSNAAHYTDSGQYLEWSQTGDQYVDDVGPQTIWMRVYASALPTSDVVFFESVYNTSNYVQIKVNTAEPEFTGYYRAAGVIKGAAGNSVTAAWVDIAYSWDKTNQDHSFYNGSTWEDDNNELLDDMAGDFTAITIGHHTTSSNNFDGGKYINIEQFAIMDGYKTGVPW